MSPANFHKMTRIFKFHMSCQHSLACDGACYTLPDVPRPLQHGSHRALFKQCQ